MTGTTKGWPRLILQMEGAALLVIAAVVYTQIGAGLGLFALLILAPDIAMLGYLHDSRLGALIYNLGHSTIGPLALSLLGWATSSFALPLGLIWLAHVGLDRMLGYGLKYGDAFKHTHLSALRG